MGGKGERIIFVLMTNIYIYMCVRINICIHIIEDNELSIFSERMSREDIKITIFHILLPLPSRFHFKANSAIATSLTPCLYQKRFLQEGFLSV